MKKLLIMSIALVAIMATVFTVSAFAANTVEITGVTLSKYGSADTFNDAYANVTVNYTVPEGTVDRLTFYLAAQDLSSALEGEEAKVIYIDEQVNPETGSLTFIIEKSRVRTALVSAEKIDSTLTTGKANAAAENLVLTFKLGGTDVDTAASKTVVYNNPTKYGDPSGDGKIMAVDVGMIAAGAAGNVVLNAERKAAADVNGDGAVKAVDTGMAAACSVGNIPYTQILNARTYAY
jgi:hypothetical protein